MSTIAATSTLAMVRAAEARGVQVADLLDQLAVTRAELEDPDARLHQPQVAVLWNALRDRTGDRALQLAAPAMLPWGTYRVIDYIVAASATVGEGIERFARFFGLIADAVTLSIERTGTGIFLDIATVDGRPVPPVYVDYVFAALVGRIRMRMRPGLRVLRVELRQSEPDDPSPYRELFGAPIRFSAPADRLGFSDHEWREAAADPDAALAQLMEDHARLMTVRGAPARPGLHHDVRNAIATTLGQGATADTVARILHMSVRSLQRKLAATGTTFRDVSETVRAQFATAYLSEPEVGIAEIAFLLGFSDQSAFNRAFRRWTGEAPGRWRRLHHVDSATGSVRSRHS